MPCRPAMLASVLRVSTLPRLADASLDSGLFGLLSLIRACFRPCFELKHQLNLLNYSFNGYVNRQGSIESRKRDAADI